MFIILKTYRKNGTRISFSSLFFIRDSRYWCCILLFGGLIWFEISAGNENRPKVYTNNMNANVSNNIEKVFFDSLTHEKSIEKTDFFFASVASLIFFSSSVAFQAIKEKMRTKFWISTPQQEISIAYKFRIGIELIVETRMESTEWEHPVKRYLIIFSMEKIQIVFGL